MKRVYHPTLNAWQDVQDVQHASWLEAGWKDEKPKGFDDSEEKLVEVGQGYTQPPVTDNTPGAAHTGDDTLQPPAGNASLADWQGYAATQGASMDDLEGLTRDELRNAYGPPA